LDFSTNRVWDIDINKQICWNKAIWGNSGFRDFGVDLFGEFFRIFSETFLIYFIEF
jgi:hypothetical protein